MSTIPKHEPELRLAKGRAYAARCNEIAAGHDSKTIYQALELSEQAYAVYQLPYASGPQQPQGISAKSVRMDLREEGHRRVSQIAGQAKRRYRELAALGWIAAGRGRQASSAVAQSRPVSLLSVHPPLSVSQYHERRKYGRA